MEAITELDAKKKRLQEELEQIEKEEEKAIRELQNQKKKFPSNVIPINKTSTKRLIRQIEGKDSKEIELWARGKMIQKAFYIAGCDSIGKMFSYKEVKPPFLEKVEDKKKKGEMFDIATVKIVMQRKA